eukprot:1776755-Alexandrium_andersonii.AAC.1
MEALCAVGPLAKSGQGPSLVRVAHLLALSVGRSKWREGLPRPPAMHATNQGCMGNKSRNSVLRLLRVPPAPRAPDESDAAPLSRPV